MPNSNPTHVILNLLFDPSDTTLYTPYGRFAPYADGKPPLQTSKAWLQSTDGQTYTFYERPTQSSPGTNPGRDNVTPLIKISQSTQVGIRVGAVGGSWPRNYAPVDGPLYGWDPGGVASNLHALMITAVFGRHSQAGNQKWASPFQTPAAAADTPLVGNLITEVFYNQDPAKPLGQGDFDSQCSCTMWLGTPSHLTSNTTTDRYLFNVGAVIKMTIPAPQTAWFSFGHDPDMEVSM